MKKNKPKLECQVFKEDSCKKYGEFDLGIKIDNKKDLKLKYIGYIIPLLCIIFLLITTIFLCVKLEKEKYNHKWELIYAEDKENFSVNFMNGNSKETCLFSNISMSKSLNYVLFINLKNLDKDISIDKMQYDIKELKHKKELLEKDIEESEKNLGILLKKK